MGTWKRLSFFILPREGLKLVPSHVYWSYVWPNFTDLIFVLWTYDFLKKPTSYSKCKLKRRYKLQIIRQHPVRICLLHLNQSRPGTKLQNTEEWQRRTHQQRSIDYQWCLWIQMTKVCFSLEKNKWIPSKSWTFDTVNYIYSDSRIELMQIMFCLNSVFPVLSKALYGFNYDLIISQCVINCHYQTPRFFANVLFNRHWG